MGGAFQGDDDGVISGINITPLVDITLVLLIVFMVTAKIIVSTSLPLDLPKAAKGETVQLVFGLEVHASGDLLVDGKKVDNDKAILALARESLARNKDLRAVIRADSKVQHGRIITILDLLKQAGVSKIAFGVTPISAEPGPGESPGGETPKDSDKTEDKGEGKGSGQEAPTEGK
ncbi:MAG: biopolymer transporter ExbD [Deltaproteobacteria bacterium]|nr:MAG: biopolymer transporter ExbD [Deltaproteobacteria bacterium]